MLATNSKSFSGKSPDYSIDAIIDSVQIVRMARYLFDFGNIAERVVELLLPGRCAFCALPSTSRCCDKCAALLPKNEICCHRCANPLTRKFDGACADCQQQTPDYTATIAPLIYEFPVDTALKAMK